MKKILYIMMMALAVAFTACDDDFAYPPVSLGDIQGDGTKDSPYNVAGAIRAAARNGETSDQFVYVEGYVVSGSIDTSYGNASFDLYDSPDGSGSKFICYRIKGFNNQKFTDENQVKPGDKIIIYAPVINYKGNTPETGTGGYLYAINGVVGSDTPDEPAEPSDPKGDGTIDSPYNIAKAIEVAKANGETSDVMVYVEGYVASGSIDTSYGNATWDLTDDPNGAGAKFIAYRVKDFDNQKFTDANKVKKGDKIVIYAPVINYKGNTPETGSGGYLISVNGQGNGAGGDTPAEPGTPAGDGTAASPYNIARAIEVAQANGETSDVMVYVEGYVGSGSIDTSYGNATWDLYDDASATGAKFIAYRVKDFDNQKFTDANKVKVGDKVVVYGPVINYKGNTPETGSGAYLYSINGQTGGSDPGQPANPGTPAGEGTVDAPYNVARALEVAVANGQTSDVSVYTEGYVISGSIDTSYGNGTWDICDNADGSTATIKVFRAKDFNNEKFTDANKVKVGDKIVVYAPIINYMGNTPETNLGYLYSINGQTAGDNPGGGDTPQPGTGDPITATSADFNTLNGGVANFNSYGTYYTADGWTATWSLVLSGGTEATEFISSDASMLFPCIDGTPARPGTLTSPVIAGGLGTLTFEYGFPYGETKVGFTVNIKQDGQVVATDTVVVDPAVKGEKATYTHAFNVTGDFVIEIVNDCITQSTNNNKDRIAIWNLHW